MNKEIKIGLFTIAMILVVWGGVRFLSGIDLMSSNRDYYAYYSEIDGIQKASPIFVKGVKVGTVTSIDLDRDRNSKVALTLTIANRFDIPQDSEAKIFSDGLMGGKAIEIILGESEESIEPGGEIASSCEVGLFEVAGSELDYLKQRIDMVTVELTSTLSNLNKLLESNSENIGGVIANMNKLSYNLNALLEQNQEDLTAMIGGMSNFSSTLGDNSQQIDSIIMNINGLTRGLSEAQLGSSLAESISQLNTLMAQINSTEGSAAKILRDEALYDNLASASANLDSLLYDVKQNPKRYVNISVFGGNEMKRAEKAQKRASKDAIEAEKDRQNELRKSANKK